MDQSSSARTIDPQDWTRSLEELLRDGYPWIFTELGFRVVGSTFSPRRFGDSVVVLASDAFRIRFDRDKFRVGLEIAVPQEPGKWWGDVAILEAISGSLPEFEGTLEWHANFLRRNFPALVEALGPKYETTRQALDAKREERLREVDRLYVQKSGDSRSTSRSMPWLRAISVAVGRLFKGRP